MMGSVRQIPWLQQQWAANSLSPFLIATLAPLNREHLMKSVQIRSFFWSEYRKIRTRRNSTLRHFSRSAKEKNGHVMGFKSNWDQLVFENFQKKHARYCEVLRAKK